MMDKKTPIVAATVIAAMAGLSYAVISSKQEVPAPVSQQAAAPIATAPAAPAVPAPAAEPQQQAAVEPQAAAPAPQPQPAEQPAAAAQPAPAAEQPAPAVETNSTPAAPAAEQPQQSLTPEAPLTPAEPPSFDTVRVEPSGEAVIAGRAAPGAEVAVKFGDVVVGTAKAEADGSFVVVPDKPLPAGTGALTLETRNGAETLVSKDAVAVAVTGEKPALVAKVEPQAPVKIVQGAAAPAGKTPEEVAMSAIDYDDQGNMVFQGLARPEATVRFYVDNGLAGETRADKDGRWQFQSAAPIAPGQHMLRADEIDATGKVTSRAETPFLRETPEKVIAAAEPASQPADQVVQKTPAPAAQESAAAVPAQQTVQKTQEQIAAAEPQPATVPEATLPMAAAAEPGGPMRIVIQPGNNLWRISRQMYGKGKMYTIIWQANREQIRNANKIYPGQILTAPAKPQ